MSIWSAMKHASTWLENLGNTAKEATERIRVGMGLDEPITPPDTLTIEDKTRPEVKTALENVNGRGKVKAGK